MMENLSQINERSADTSPSNNPRPRCISIDVSKKTMDFFKLL